MTWDFACYRFEMSDKVFAAVNLQENGQNHQFAALPKKSPLPRELGHDRLDRDRTSDRQVHGGEG